MGVGRSIKPADDIASDEEKRCRAGRSPASTWPLRHSVVKEVFNLEIQTEASEHFYAEVYVHPGKGR